MCLGWRKYPRRSAVFCAFISVFISHSWSLFQTCSLSALLSLGPRPTSVCVRVIVLTRRPTVGLLFHFLSVPFRVALQLLHFHHCAPFLLLQTYLQPSPSSLQPLDIGFFPLRLNLAQQCCLKLNLFIRRRVQALNRGLQVRLPSTPFQLSPLMFA